jgi:acyl carrier protein
MEEKVLNVLKSVFEIDTIDNTCSQDNCEAWDSMNHLNLILELQDAFNVDFEPEEISKMKCFKDIISVLKGKGC